MRAHPPRQTPEQTARSLLGAVSIIQAVYAAQLLLFFRRPALAVNRMLVIVECLFLIPFLFKTGYSRQITALAGRRFERGCGVVIFLAALAAVWVVWTLDTVHTNRMMLCLMVCGEASLLRAFVLSLRAWSIIRKTNH